MIVYVLAPVVRFAKRWPAISSYSVFLFVYKFTSLAADST